MNAAGFRMNSRLGRWFGIATIALAAGCSARDPVNRTPYYHIGTPTNRASVNSWELYDRPNYAQPGANHGDPVPAAAPIPSQRRYEPYDELAQSVYTALNSAKVDTRYVSVTAKKGVVVLTGSVDDRNQLNQANRVASQVNGVRQVRCELKAVKG